MVIDFWTYSCINCLRSIPYVKAWDERYRKNGLVVIGVHAPEFAFERNADNVRRAVADLGIRYPVALDNDYVLWRALHNNYWPAHYFVDAAGACATTISARAITRCPERVIRQLLAEAGHAPANVGMANRRCGRRRSRAGDRRTEVARDLHWLCARRPLRLARRAGARRSQDLCGRTARAQRLVARGRLARRKQSARSLAPGAKISFRFHARDLHLVLGPAAGKPVRFRVTLDGQAPGPTPASMPRQTEWAW